MISRQKWDSICKASWRLTHHVSSVEIFPRTAFAFSELFPYSMELKMWVMCMCVCGWLLMTLPIIGFMFLWLYPSLWLCPFLHLYELSESFLQCEKREFWVYGNAWKWKIAHWLKRFFVSSLSLYLIIIIITTIIVMLVRVSCGSCHHRHTHKHSHVP